jgi:hypothetical protein
MLLERRREQAKSAVLDAKLEIEGRGNEAAQGGMTNEIWPAPKATKEERELRWDLEESNT